MKYYALLLMVFSFALATASFAADIVVTGSGVVSTDPDMARVSMGVDVLKDTAAQAQDANARTMDKIIAALRSAGVKNEDMQTSSYSLREERSYQDRVPKTVGYRCGNQVTVKLNDLKKVGKIIDTGTLAGANSVNSVWFYRKDDSEQKKLALKMAYKEALEKAEALAQAAGKSIGGINQIMEAGAQTIEIQPIRAMNMMKAEAETPILAGQVEVRAEITASFLVN
ncbi:MAG: SIMPL domain-containing protein [Candidatus Margulisiibacteriota bacterium]